MTPRSFPRISHVATLLACAGSTFVFSACSKQEKETAAAPKVEAPAPAPAPQVTTAPAKVTPPTSAPVTSAPATATPVVVAKPASPGFDTVDQRVSYGIGYQLGSGFGRQKAEVAIDADALKAGLEDGMAGVKTRVLPSDLQAAFALVQQRAMESQAAATKTYFEKNRAREGVTVTASGLQYEVITHGKGAVKPKLTDTVTVHYEGKLLDGTVFDSSIQRGSPAQFTVGGVIKGWTEALQLMTVGDKWRLHIPPNLAYGPSGNGKIPPNSGLVFEVELLGIK